MACEPVKCECCGETRPVVRCDKCQDVIGRNDMHAQIGRLMVLNSDLPRPPDHPNESPVLCVYCARQGVDLIELFETAPQYYEPRKQACTGKAT